MYLNYVRFKYRFLRTYYVKYNKHFLYKCAKINRHSFKSYQSSRHIRIYSPTESVLVLYVLHTQVVFTLLIDNLLLHGRHPTD